MTCPSVDAFCPRVFRRDCAERLDFNDKRLDTTNANIRNIRSNHFIIVIAFWIRACVVPPS